MPDFIRRPCRQDFPAERRLEIGAFGHREVGPVALGQQHGDAVVLLNQGPPRHFGRMRRQHELDLECAHRLVQSRGRHPACHEPAERLFRRAALGTRARIAEIGATAADAMMLLGDVRQVQEVCERAGERNRGVDRQLLELGGQRLEVAIRARAGRLGHGADALDGLEQPIAFVGAERVAQQLAEEPDILSQRFVRIDLHRVRSA